MCRLSVCQNSSAATVACTNLLLCVRRCPTGSLGSENCQASWCGSIPLNFRREVSLGTLGNLNTSWVSLGAGLGVILSVSTWPGCRPL